MDEKVGVVVPTFNRPHFTLRAVKSALNQSCPPEQIVVVDDGSDSSNSELLANLLSGLNVELIVTSPSRHPGIARNIGVSALRTKWVAFLDSDDVWVPHKLESQIRSMVEYGTKASCTNAFINQIDSELLYLQKSKDGILKTKSLMKSNEIINSSVIIDRELLLEVGGIASSYSVRGAEDYATWLRVSTLTKWKYLSNPSVIYSIESLDSLRKSNEFPQKYLHVSGILDFASWLEHKKAIKSIYLRIFLKLLPMIVSFSRRK
jgi:glycosyltransferase involved in cell wall biosynthesis